MLDDRRVDHVSHAACSSAVGSCWEQHSIGNATAMVVPLGWCDHPVWHPELAPGRADLLRGWHQAEHPLLGKAAREGPDGFRMGAGFLSALRGGALRVEEQRADEFIALLDGVTERQMRVVRLCMGSHEGSLPCRRSGLGPPERL